MTIFLASLAGVPPLGGWFAKFTAFRAVLDAGNASALHARRHRRRQHRHRRRLLPEGDARDVDEPVPDGDDDPDRSRRRRSSAALGITRRRHARARRPARPGRSASATSRTSPARSAAERSGRLDLPTDEIRPAIAAAAGPIPFERVHGARAVRRATGSTPRGERRAGRRGDFLTSPEVGPLFGAVLARFLDARVGAARPAGPVHRRRRRRRAGHAGPVGPRRRARRCAGALRYVAVEVVGGAAGAPPRRRRVRSDLPDRPVRRGRHRQRAARQPAVPSGRVRRRLAGGVRRRRAATARSPRCCRRRSTGAGRRCPPRPPHGAACPAAVDAAAAWVDAAPRSAAARVASSRSTTPARRRPSWPRCRGGSGCARTGGHERGGHYLADPGGRTSPPRSRSTSCPPPDARAHAGAVPAAWGIDELVEEGRRAWAAAAARPTSRR